MARVLSIDSIAQNICPSQNEQLAELSTKVHENMMVQSMRMKEGIRMRGKWLFGEITERLAIVIRTPVRLRSIGLPPEMRQ